VQPGFPVLVVEDNSDDVLFVQLAFDAARLRHPLLSVRDGRQAIEYLSGAGQYADRKQFPLPKVVFTDLTMPHVTGFDLIKWMRNDAHARRVPVIVLSGSGLAKDVNRSYELGANAYMVKPADARALERLLRTIGEFWDLRETPEFASLKSSAAATPLMQSRRLLRRSLDCAARFWRKIH
jgi:CheY-like chemotaxis protein